MMNIKVTIKHIIADLVTRPGSKLEVYVSGENLHIQMGTREYLLCNVSLIMWLLD